MKTARNLAIAAGLLLLPALVAGGVPQYPSAWATVPVKMDGIADPWVPLLRPLSDMPMVIGVQNDADFLYLCFKTSDPNVKKQMRETGLTVWLNASGKSSMAKGFGVRYPLKKLKRDDEPKRREPEPPDDGSVRPFVPPPPNFELIGPTEDDRQRFELGAGEPVDAALGDDSGVMVLELKLPLKASGVYSLALKGGPATVLGLGLGTTVPKEKPGKLWAENVNSHGRKPQPAEDAPQMTAPFTLWVQVPLAPPPPAAK